MSSAAHLRKAEQACQSARNLLEADDPDGACNRAYYAMFDAALAALSAVGVDPGKTHKGVLGAFSEHFVKTAKVSVEVGRLLKQAEARRYIADYGSDNIDLAEAKVGVEQAVQFVAILRPLVMSLSPEG